MFSELLQKVGELRRTKKQTADEAYTALVERAAADKLSNSDTPGRIDEVLEAAGTPVEHFEADVQRLRRKAELAEACRALPELHAGRKAVRERRQKRVADFVAYKSEYERELRAMGGEDGELVAEIQRISALKSEYLELNPEAAGRLRTVKKQRGNAAMAVRNAEAELRQVRSELPIRRQELEQAQGRITIDRDGVADKQAEVKRLAGEVKALERCESELVASIPGLVAEREGAKRAAVDLSTGVVAIADPAGV